jgi:hypothetical protein
MSKWHTFTYDLKDSSPTSATAELRTWLAENCTQGRVKTRGSWEKNTRLDEFYYTNVVQVKIKNSEDAATFKLKYSARLSTMYATRWKTGFAMMAGRGMGKTNMMITMLKNRFTASNKPIVYFDTESCMLKNWNDLPVLGITKSK